MNNLKKYLECDDENVLDIYDSLVDQILEQKSEQEEMVSFLKDQIQLVDIKKKIRILQLLNEVLSCNDQNFKSLISEHFLELLKEYYEHQSKTVQSNYLCQEDEIEVIELYLHVNKIIGYFEIQKEQNNRISIGKLKEEVKPQFESRASIYLDEYQVKEDKCCQTEEDQELQKWKKKWELQFNYNQRLQKINSQLRMELANSIDQIQIQQKVSSLQNNKLQMSFGNDEEEDQIIVQDFTPKQIISSIMKKPDEKKQKKKVQFLQRKVGVQCQDYDQFLNSMDPSQVVYLKKCCFSKLGIIFDDRSVQILIQLSDQVEFESALTILNRSAEEIKLSFIYKQPVNVSLRIRDYQLNSKKSIKQTIYNDKDELLQLQIHYEIQQQSFDKLILIPNFLYKYLQFNQLNQQQYNQHMDEIRDTDGHVLLICLAPIVLDEENIIKLIPNYLKIGDKYVSSMNYKQIQFYVKIRQKDSRTVVKILIDQNNEKFGVKLIQTDMNFMPKLYAQDGTGRDSYIFFNNGGFYPAQQRFLARNMQESWTYGSPRGEKLGGSIEKRQFYLSNGTGRDTYIMKTVQDKVKSVPDFQYQLRKYESEILSPRYPYKLPPLKQAAQLEKSVHQQSLTKRLAVPKLQTLEHD